MLTDAWKMLVSKARITASTTGLGALTTTQGRNLPQIITMVYAFREYGWSLFRNDFWGRCATFWFA